MEGEDREEAEDSEGRFDIAKSEIVESAIQVQQTEKMIKKKRRVTVKEGILDEFELELKRELGFEPGRLI